MVQIKLESVTKGLTLSDLGTDCTSCINICWKLGTQFFNSIEFGSVLVSFCFHFVKSLLSFLLISRMITSLKLVIWSKCQHFYWITAFSLKIRIKLLSLLFPLVIFKMLPQLSFDSTCWSDMTLNCMARRSSFSSKDAQKIHSQDIKLVILQQLWMSLSSPVEHSLKFNWTVVWRSENGSVLTRHIQPDGSWGARLSNNVCANLVASYSKEVIAAKRTSTKHAYFLHTWMWIFLFF